MSKCTGKYLGSPLYRGSNLWGKLEYNVQDLTSVKYFTRALLKDCRTYKDLQP